MDLLNFIYLITGIAASIIVITPVVNSLVKRYRRSKQPKNSPLIIPTVITRQKKARKKRTWVIIIPVLCILILGSSILILRSSIPFFFLASRTVVTPSPSSTATAQAKRTPTAQSSASASTSPTGTVQTNCSSAPQTSTTTATVASLPPPYASYQGKLVLDDSMCIPAAHWDVFTDRSPNSPPTCLFTKNAYYVETEKVANICGNSLSPHQGFQNFVYQIRITFVNDQTCGGIVFDQYSSSSVSILMDFHDFLICTDQTYKLERINYDYPVSKVLRNDSSTTIHEGIGNSNIIAVLAHGATLDLYINGQKIESVSDSTLSAGTIGVIGINLISGDTTTKEVAFNDAKLWTL